MFKCDKNKISYTKRVISEFERGNYIVDIDTILENLDSINTQKDVDTLVSKFSFRPAKFLWAAKERKLRSKIYSTRLYREWVDYCKGHKKHRGLLYCIEAYNKDERFLKIGITSTDLYKRFLDFPYKYKVVEAEEFTNMSELYIAEYKLLKKLERYKYTPKIVPFTGWTECIDIKMRRRLQRIFKFKLY